jgi:transcription elongation factor GreA
VKAGALDQTLTTEGLARLQAELEELTGPRRRDVIDRVRTAREHGDLKENAEYHAAREEQSFLEGRIQALELRLRNAPVASTPANASRVGLGSRVTIEVDGVESTFEIVGSSDSDPAQGRISGAAPVGRALVGRQVGDIAIVRTPGGEVSYRVIAID